MIVENWSWGFSFLCPKCKMWASYHSPTEQPKYLSYTIDLHNNMKPKELLARFDCDNCGEDLTIEVAEFPGGS